jgi:hypothetical protein
MSSKQLIHYESLHCKVNFKYTSYLKDDFEINGIEDIERNLSFCYGGEQYIKSFIDSLKDKVIKYLPQLNKVNFILAIFDKNNVMHRFIIATSEILRKMLGIERKINYYKSIFVIIEYDNKIVFTGNLNFEGIN